MMFNRLRSLLFVFIAHIVLLGHAVVPHHHNNSFPSYIAYHDHDQSEDRCLTEEHHSDNHNHSSDDDLKHCILNQFFVHQSFSFRLEIKYPENCHTGYCQHIPFASNSSPIELGYTVRKKRFRQLLRSDYTCMVARVLGLRAPPSGFCEFLSSSGLV